MSRDCDDVLAKLYHYIDSELDQATADWMRSHLGDCPDCDRPVLFELRLRQVIRTHLEEDAPEVFITRLKGVLAVEQGHSPEIT